MLNIAFWTIFVLFIVLSVMLTLLVLVQKSKGGGLVGAVSGAKSLIGSGAPQVVTWLTTAAFGLFILLAVTLNLLANAR
jgi:protein translocase SecG subunit